MNGGNDLLMPDTSEQKPGWGGATASGRLLTANEVSGRLRVPVSWVRKHGAELPGVVRLGKYIRWDSAKLDQFIAAGGLG